MRENVVKRFGKKSSGFMKGPPEPTLEDLKLFSDTYRFSSKTANDFLMRYLVKASGVTQNAIKDAGPLPFINFCCDAARACTYQATGSSVM